MDKKIQSLSPKKSENVIRNIILLGIVVGVIFPMLPQVVWSITHRWLFPSVTPSEFSLRSWKYIANPNTKVIIASINSLVIALSVTVIGLVIGIPAAKVLGMYQFKGKGLVELIILAPAIVPPLAATMGIQVIFIRLGLSDTMLGVILVHLIPTLPYIIVSLSGVFANYDPQFEEQARTLGATKSKTFFLITLPAIFPGIVTGGMFAFLISWGQYILTILVGGGRILTLPILLFSFTGSGDNAIASALSIVFVLPAIIILIITSKYLSGKSSGMGGFGSI